MSLSAIGYLRHISEENRIFDRASARSNLRAFMRDATLKRAFVRSLEIIGEVSKQIPDDFKQEYSYLEKNFSLFAPIYSILSKTFSHLTQPQLKNLTALILTFFHHFSLYAADLHLTKARIF
jgi:hypothetical protein